MLAVTNWEYIDGLFKGKKTFTSVNVLTRHQQLLHQPTSVMTMQLKLVKHLKMVF